MHYIIGDIKQIEKNFLIIETEQKIGFRFNYFKSLGDKGFETNITSNNKVFVTEIKSDFESFYFCFENENNQRLFSELNKIKTVGIKTAKLIMKSFEHDEIIQIIQDNDFEKLEDLKNIGSFTAKVIINELQKVYFKVTYNSKQLSVIDSLQKLGYNQRRIYQAVSKIDNNLKIEEMFQKVLVRVVENEQSSI
ncbi:Holliday junction branch migration protein RuvA [Spiroplasma alleghenense]|uniref:Holliday junction DNA helicase RuvA n=1 Tax=Spiroplasma alleghenense TaxID=216931 RepID=A0A345Z3L9_9MOLU|nr:Holliday junction branch migration protein RuvA [Spiroplasma alleghenense]AXK51198.1 Holliday junction DNA helicase RuvA [Spiroplasma alleghenense]